MLRLSKLTDYAVVVLIRLAVGRGGDTVLQTSPGIAVATGVPEPTVAKVLKALAPRAWWSRRAARAAAIGLPSRCDDFGRRRDRGDRRPDRADRLCRRLTALCDVQSSARCGAAGIW